MRNSRLVQEVRGVMTRFEPLTPEFVAANTEDGLTYEEVAGSDVRELRLEGNHDTASMSPVEEEEFRRRAKPLIEQL